MISQSSDPTCEVQFEKVTVESLKGAKRSRNDANYITKVSQVMQKHRAILDSIYNELKLRVKGGDPNNKMISDEFYQETNKIISPDIVGRVLKDSKKKDGNSRPVGKKSGTNLNVKRAIKKGKTGNQYRRDGRPLEIEKE